jgi:hypothetical protein
MAEKRMNAADELRKSEMMAHLMDALDAGKDIGHYGKLVFAMVAHRFMDDAELVGWLRKAPDMGEEEAKALAAQVKARDYNPPRREKVLQWQAEQEFPICPNADDPNACNVYRDLQFPEDIYENIEEFYERKAETLVEA